MDNGKWKMDIKKMGYFSVCVNMFICCFLNYIGNITDIYINWF